MHARQPGAGRGRRLRASSGPPHDAREQQAGASRRARPAPAPARARPRRYLAAAPRGAGAAASSWSAIRCPTATSSTQRVQRFATYADLDRHETTIEEREEYEPHLDAGRVVYAGVDYEAILRAAEEEADVVLWDGGNNDFPFYRPDLFVVVADPLRPGHEMRYHPGETNLRMADVIVINKVDSATPEQVGDGPRATSPRLNPRGRGGPGPLGAHARRRRHRRASGWRSSRTARRSPTAG